MTNREILTKRKRIELDLQKAKDRASDEARKVRAPAEGDQARAREALATGRTEIARGVLGVDVPALTQSVEEAELAVDEARAQGEVNTQTVKNLEGKLKNCLCDDGHFEVYKIIAEKATQEADAALRGANASIEYAARLWGVAVNTWQPLREAVNTDDLKRRPPLKPVPDFPLSQGYGAARPANVTEEEVTKL
jgi:hypothetical protein